LETRLHNRGVGNPLHHNTLLCTMSSSLE
jgi:hypothetical protein